MNDVSFIVSTLFGAYALGWVWGKSMLAFKRFMEVST